MHGNNIYMSQCTPPKVYNYTQSGILVGSAFIDGCYIDLVVGPNGSCMLHIILGIILASST